MRSRLRTMGPAVLFAVALCAVAAAAPSQVLSARITPVVRPRTDAPVPARVGFTYTGRPLLEGHLLATFRDGGRTVGRYRMFDVALVQGEHTYSVMLPPMKAQPARSVAQLEIELVFRTEDRDIELYPDTLIATPWEGRAAVVGACTPWQKPAGSLSRMLAAFNWADRMPEALRRTGRGIDVYIAHTVPENLPASPMRLCAYDILVFAGDAFTALRQRQLDALLRWVQAGGSVCVIPGGAPLRARHVAFLHRLAGKPGQFITDAGGIVSAVEAPDRPIHYFRPEMGRATVVMRRTFDDAYGASREWNRMVAFLWRVRAEFENEFAGRQPLQAFGTQPTASTYRGEYGAVYVPSPALQDLSRNLLPEEIRLIPFSLVTVLLVGFLLLIGPVDYYVLGALRVRVLTWVLFPLSCIALTVVTVFAANMYMGRDDYRVSCTVVDLGADNRILRTSRLEQLYVGQNRTVVSEVKGAMFVGIDPRAYRSRSRSADVAFSYSGHVPAAYEVRQSLAQWAPQMNRIGRFTDKDATPPIDFDRVTFADLRDVNALVGKLGAGNLKGGVYLVRGDRVHRLYSHGPEPLTRPGRRHNVYDQRRQVLMMIEDDRRRDSSFLLEICSRAPVGAFRVLSQVAPNFGPTIEDLTLLDSSADDAAVLVAVERDGKNVTIYRRLYTEDPR